MISVHGWPTGRPAWDERVALKRIEAVMEQDSAELELVPIGAVVELLRPAYPDVSHSSLRFLEREGLITPTRTPGGHRLFTAADLERLRQIKDWQAQRLSLEQIRQRLAARDNAGTPADLAAQFLQQALGGHLEQARRTILTASDLGIPLDQMFMSVLTPALWELGRRWEAGEISVAQEKEVSHVARDLIAELGMRASHVADEASDGVVAACVAGERHELGLLMVSGLLRRHGVSVAFLGADVAAAFLADAVKRRQPRAVLLSATSDAYLPAIQAAADAVRATGVGPRLLAGGQAVERQPAIVTGWGVTPIMLDDLQQIDDLASSLLAEPPA
jgi:DNA-binding transcriptional MerR regulator/methylmalonyl-CoA mutase cobalamin-binding subunit